MNKNNFGTIFSIVIYSFFSKPARIWEKFLFVTFYNVSSVYFNFPIENTKVKNWKFQKPQFSLHVGKEVMVIYKELPFMCKSTSIQDVCEESAHLTTSLFFTRSSLITDPLWKQWRKSFPKKQFFFQFFWGKNNILCCTEKRK